MDKPNETAGPASVTTLVTDLRVVLGRLIRRLREESQVGDFSWSQLKVLARLEQDGPATVTTLAAAEGVRSQSMGATISSLKALGFVAGEKWMDGDVFRGVMMKSGATELGLSQDDWKMGKDRKKGLGFRIFCATGQDVDAIAARVKAAGFSLTEEPADQPAWGVRSFSVDDPDGYHLTITRDL